MIGFEIQWAFILAFFMMVVIALPKLRAFSKLWCWKRRLKINQHVKIFQRIYHATNGFEISRKARSHKDAPEYLYGEIDFTAFIALVSLTHPKKQMVFYDLGSGVGKAVIACAMVFDVKRSCGIELFQPLHQAAQNQLQNLKKIPGYEKKSERIRLTQGNFLQTSVKDATLIFINATAFFGEVWEQLNEKLLELAVGTTVITTTKSLTSEGFFVLHETNVQMSWGVVKAYIHKRR